MSEIYMKHITKFFGNLKALDRVNFTVEKGSALSSWGEWRWQINFDEYFVWALSC